MRTCLGARQSAIEAFALGYRGAHCPLLPLTMARLAQRERRVVGRPRGRLGRRHRIEIEAVRAFLASLPSHLLGALCPRLSKSGCGCGGCGCGGCGGGGVHLGGALKVSARVERRALRHGRQVVPFGRPAARGGRLRGGKARLDLREAFELGFIDGAALVEHHRPTGGRILVLLEDARRRATLAVQARERVVPATRARGGCLGLLPSPRLGHVDVLEHLGFVIECVVGAAARLPNDGLVGEREHHALARREVVRRVPHHCACEHGRAAAAAAAAAATERIIELVVHGRLRRESRASGSGRRLLRPRFLVALLALHLLPARLGHPRRRRVHLLARKLLSERRAGELLMEQALAARRIELFAHRILRVRARHLRRALLPAHPRLLLSVALLVGATAIIGRVLERLEAERGTHAIGLFDGGRDLAAGVAHLHRDCVICLVHCAQIRA